MERHVFFLPLLAKLYVTRGAEPFSFVGLLLVAFGAGDEGPERDRKSKNP
jgi:hypothetical protein